MHLKNNNAGGISKTFNIGTDGSTLFEGVNSFVFKHKDATDKEVKAFLNIHGKVSKDLGQTTFFKPGQIDLATGAKDYSLWSSNAIAAQELNVFSDERIKTNIKDIDEEKLISMIKNINLKEYNYIDAVSRGSDSVLDLLLNK